MKNIARYYDKLTATERAALTVDAFGRNDDVEAKRLADSCPMFNYRCNDLAYTMRLTELHRLALLYEVEVLELRCQLIAAISLIANAAASDYESFFELPMQCRTLAAKINAWHRAWRLFCAEVGFDVDATLSAFGIMRRAICVDDMLDEVINPVQNDVESAAAKLSELWHATIDNLG
jgi:hypothetical protein